MGSRLLTITLLILTCSAMLSGCAKALEDLVRLKRPTGALMPFEGQTMIKISPGNTVAVSSDISMTAHVTITNRPLTGADVSAHVSMSRHKGDSAQ